MQEPIIIRWTSTILSEQPPKSKIEAWKQTKAEREKKKKEKEEKDKGGSPAGAFIDGLIDIDDERFGESVHMVGTPNPFFHSFGPFFTKIRKLQKYIKILLVFPISPFKGGLFFPL